jgi:hypothetical protein
MITMFFLSVHQLVVHRSSDIHIIVTTVHLGLVVLPLIMMAIDKLWCSLSFFQSTSSQGIEYILLNHIPSAKFLPPTTIIERRHSNLDAKVDMP